MKKCLSVILLLGMLEMTFVGCQSPKQSQSLSQNPSTSKSEKTSGNTSKKLVVYTPASEDLIDKIIPAFEKETGIKVEVVAASTGELLTRIKSEAANPIADVMWGGSPSLIMPLKDNFENYISPNDKYLESEFKNAEGYITRYSSTCPVLLVNTNLAGNIQINGYEDLLNPALKGKIAFGDASSSSSSFNHLENMLFAMGKNNDPNSNEAWAYVKAFLENLDGKIASSSSIVHKGVADGEYIVGLTYEEPAVGYLKDGAPVKVVYMKEGVIFKQSASYIIKNAKNLENAKLFSDFLLSEYVQNVLGLETANRPVRSDAKLAEYKTPISNIKTIKDNVMWGVDNKEKVIARYMDLLTK